MLSLIFDISKSSSKNGLQNFRFKEKLLLSLLHVIIISFVFSVGCARINYDEHQKENDQNDYQRQNPA